MKDSSQTRDIVSNIISIVLMVVESLILLRFMMKLFIANEGASFVAWIYQTSDPLLRPFEGILPTAAESGSIFDMTTLLAIIVYAFLGYLLIAIVDGVHRHSKKREL